MKQHLLTLFLALAASVAPLFAQSGTCGTNLTWTLDTESGILTISGTGAMTNYTSSSNVPWDSYRSSIKTVTIDNSVTSIGEYAFYECSKLTSITIPNSVTSIGNYTFKYCSSLTSVTIPNSVTSIGYSAFSDCSSLVSVTIPNSVTSIGYSAFSDCSSLTSVTIPNSVTSIGSYAFYNCSSLTSITIPNSVTSIQWYAFSYCSSLTSVTIPNSVTSIGEGAFRYCSSLTSVTIPNSVTSIGNFAFYYCSSLTSVTIPNSVTSIGGSAFSGCRSLTSITIPNSVTSIGNSAFYNCSSLTSITIPNSVTSIGQGAFSGCSSLTSIVVENGNTKYDSRNNCNSIIETTTNTLIAGCQNTIIPSTVTSIGGYAFYNCSSLTSVTCEAVDPPTLENSVFDGVDKSILLYVPAQSIDLYKAADQWKDFTNILPIGGNECVRIIDKVDTCSTALPFTWRPWHNGGIVITDISQNGIKDIVYKEGSTTVIESIVTLNLTLHEPQKVPVEVKDTFWQCDYDLGEDNWISADVYDYELGVIHLDIPNAIGTTYKTLDTDIYGCDSITIHEVIIIPEKVQRLFEFCQSDLSLGDNIEIEPRLILEGSFWGNFSGDSIIRDTTQSLHCFGFDSITIDTIRIYPAYRETWNPGLCADGMKDAFADGIPFYDLGPVTDWSQNGLEYYTDGSIHGCDSIIVLDLTPIPNDTIDEHVQIPAFPYTFKGVTFNSIEDTLFIKTPQVPCNIYTKLIPTLIQYTVTFKNEDGSILDSRLWNYGTTPTCTEPTKPADAQYTYTFAGWEPEIAEVTGDATYIATYSQSVNQYTVTFVDYDGTVLAEPQTLAYGETPVYTGETPTRPADAQFTYLFSRWSPDITPVTGDITYTAVYSHTVNQYTVTFLNENGTIIESKQWNYGSLPVCWNTPIKSADGDHTYAFAGWTPILSAVTGDATYTATFNTIEKDTRTTVDMMQQGRIVQGYYDFDIVEYGYANTWGWKYYDVYDNLRIRHISDPSDTDPHIGIKAIPDNHSSSIRLATRSYNDVRDEDGNITDGQTAAGGVIGYVFTVTEQNAVAVLDYAAMLEYPESHETSQNYWKYYQPWVQIYISVVDDNGNNYPQEPSRIIHACMAPEGLQGWHPATTENGWEQLNNVPLYDTNGSIARNMVLLKKDWSSVGFDLRAVMGKKVCVWCEYYDCAIKSSNFAANFGDFCWDHHMARLYSALSCTQAILQKEEETCEPTASVTYSAPEGFTYRWYTAANPNAIISTDRLCTYQFAYVGEQETLYCEMQSLASMSPTTLSVNIASQCKYPLVIEADGRVTVTKIPDQETYEVGTEITLIPEPDERPICFMGWEGPDAQYVTYNGYGAFTFTMPAHDAYLRAEFRECTIHMDVVAAICESELPYHWAEADITFYESGYKEHVFHTASGADSIVTLHLNVLPSYNQVVSATIYEDELPYYWEGLTFTEAGTQTATLKTVNGCDSVVTFTLTVLFSNIVLQENEDADYYTQLAQDYNGVTVTTATLNRQFTQGKWATLCLPFDVNKALMTSLGLYNRVFELRYAEQLDDETIQMYFAPAQTLEAGKGYIVNANTKLAQKTSFVFPNVTINTDSDNGDITTLTGYNDGTGRGNLFLVGTLRTGILQGTTTGNTYLGLKDNQLYYPNSTSGTLMRAYRAVFRSDIPVNASRLRIIADGETVTELQVVGTDSSGWSDKSDQSHKSDTSARKYIDNGILYIERNGNTYNAQGQSVEQMNCK